MNSTRRAELEQLLEVHNRTRSQLEMQKAQFGMHVPTHIELGLHDVYSQIAQIEHELAGLLPDDMIHIDLWTRAGANPHTPGAQQLDWSAYFAPDPPTADVWERQLLSQLHALLNLCGEGPTCDLAVHAKAHFSAAIAFGYTFPTTSPYHLWVEQQRNEWWRSDSTIQKSSPLVAEEIVLSPDQQAVSTQSKSDVVEQTALLAVLTSLRQVLSNDFNDGELRDLCFDLGVDYESLPGQGKSDKAREFVDYMRRYRRIEALLTRGRQLRPLADWPEFHSRPPGQAQQQASTAPAAQAQELTIEISIAQQIHDDVQDTIAALKLPIGRRIQVRLAPPHTTIVDAAHAKAIAEQLREIIKQARKHSRRRPIHLFASMPVGLAVLIGAHLNACGPIQCYEHRRDHGDYVPACLLRG
jgi:SMODS-associated and fused to various effectors sensor domain/Effector-associated domain 7